MPNTRGRKISSLLRPHHCPHYVKNSGTIHYSHMAGQRSGIARTAAPHPIAQRKIARSARLKSHSPSQHCHTIWVGPNPQNSISVGIGRKSCRFWYIIVVPCSGASAGKFLSIPFYSNRIECDQVIDLNSIFQKFIGKANGSRSSSAVSSNNNGFVRELGVYVHYPASGFRCPLATVASFVTLYWSFCSSPVHRLARQPIGRVQSIDSAGFGFIHKRLYRLPVAPAVLCPSQTKEKIPAWIQLINRIIRRIRIPIGPHPRLGGVKPVRLDEHRRSGVRKKGKCQGKQQLLQKRGKRRHFETSKCVVQLPPTIPAKDVRCNKKTPHIHRCRAFFIQSCVRLTQNLRHRGLNLIHRRQTVNRGQIAFGVVVADQRRGLLVIRH